MRILAWVIIASPIVALIGIIAWPAAVLERERMRAIDIDRQIDLLEQQVNRRESLLGELRLLERASRADTQLIEAETPALAGAVLQGMVNDLLEGAGAELEATQVLPVQPSEPFTEVAIRAAFRTPIDGLREALHAFEVNEPALIVREMSVIQSGSVAASFDGPVLDVTIDLLAFGRFEPVGEEASRP